MALTRLEQIEQFQRGAGRENNATSVGDMASFATNSLFQIPKQGGRALEGAYNWLDQQSGEAQAVNQQARDIKEGRPGAPPGLLSSPDQLPNGPLQSAGNGPLQPVTDPREYTKNPLAQEKPLVTKENTLEEAGKLQEIKAGGERKKQTAVLASNTRSQLEAEGATEEQLTGWDKFTDEYDLAAIGMAMLASSGDGTTPMAALGKALMVGKQSRLNEQDRADDKEDRKLAAQYKAWEDQRAVSELASQNERRRVQNVADEAKAMQAQLEEQGRNTRSGEDNRVRTGIAAATIAGRLESARIKAEADGATDFGKVNETDKARGTSYINNNPDMFPDTQDMSATERAQYGTVVGSYLPWARKEYPGKTEKQYIEFAAGEAAKSLGDQLQEPLIFGDPYYGK
jgi:hypothetical protein